MTAPTILEVEDVEEIRDSLERLLKTDGYRVEEARGEEEAVVRAMGETPNLILVSSGGAGPDAAAVGWRIRQRAGLGEKIPVVVFCVQTIDEGAEVEVRKNLHLIRPDNFDQLRSFLGRLLHRDDVTF